jgi:signal transduction histidine kinase
MSDSHLPFGDASASVSVADIGPAIFESSNDCVKMLDRDGALLSMNKNGQCMMEIDDFRSVAGLAWPTLWPAESHGAILHALDEARAGRTGHFAAFCPTAKATPKWWDVIVTPVLASNGSVDRILSISRDVTRERQANADLLASRASLALLLESSGEGIYGLDAEQVCIFINRNGAQLLGYEAAQLIGRVLPWDAGAAAPGRREGEVCWHMDGRALALSYSVAPMAGDGVVVTFADISERKAAEEKLRDADRRKDEFLAMLAHELRNPLAPIGAAAEMLKMGKADALQVRQTSDIISRQVSHMTNLVDDLLDVSRVTRGLVTLELTQQEMGRIITDAVEQVSPLILRKRHALELRLAPGLCRVMGDQKRLVQIVSNLLNNAAKYTPAGGALTLETHVDAGMLALTVSDNGIGIGPELAERVFDLFTQAEPTSDRSSGGLGLGLALVKNLVELHGGAVSCSSAGAGRGSSFRVSLPCLADADAAPALPLQAAAARGAVGRRILLVDDNIDAATMLGMLLDASGHAVTVVHSAERALACIGEQDFDACLLDIGLPDMDGNALARRLRQHPATAACMLVAITGYGQDSDRRDTAAAGFDYHFIKPVDTHALMALLAEAA